MNSDGEGVSAKHFGHSPVKDCHSAAPPSTLNRRLNSDGEGVAAKRVGDSPVTEESDSAIIVSAGGSAGLIGSSRPARVLSLCCTPLSFQQVFQ